MDDLKINYLTWIKNLELLTHGQEGFYDITSSAIREPTEILINHIQQIDDKELLKRIREPNPWGQPQLIANISVRYGIDSDRILITSGASPALYLICKTLLSRDELVIVEEPIYEPLLAAPEAQGVRIERLRRSAEDNYEIDLDELLKKAKLKPRLIILSNLHNPSGARLSDEALKGILKIAQKYSSGVKILVDEVFHDFVKEQQRPAATLDEAFISVNSLSKVYGLSLLRVGWILAGKDIINDVRRNYVLVENNGSCFTEVLASLVVEKPDAFDDYWQNIVLANKKIAVEMMKPLLRDNLVQGAIPPYGSTYFPRIEGVADSSHFVELLAEKRKVFIVFGCFFEVLQHVCIGLGGDSQQL